MERIEKTGLRRVREPLLHPFGFKGSSLTELWQICCQLETGSGLTGTGLGVQSVLWSDGGVFARLGQEGGNLAMERTTAYALDRLRGMELTTPPDMLKILLPETLTFARKLTGQESLRTTFALNALTCVDWALWQLYAGQKNCRNFARLTAPFTDHLTARQDRLGNIPLISYDTTEEQIVSLAEEGRFFYKIKIGSNPGNQNDPEQMLHWDCRRLAQIHTLLGNLETPETDCGHPLYYLDANGRYDTLDRVKRLLDFADSIGALDRIALLEEPFPEGRLLDVSGLPVTMAGDESAHSAADAICLIEEYGYRAMALKPIAKTLSVSLEVLQAAGERGVPCFCADLTVNPAMVELNKLFAAHLPCLPGLRCGVFESNGSQNYRNWAAMCEKSPAHGKPWAKSEKGLFRLSEEYYAADGGIWDIGGDCL